MSDKNFWQFQTQKACVSKLQYIAVHISSKGPEISVTAVLPH